MQIESNLPSTIDVEARLDQIAKRYKSAGGVGINVLNVIGGSAEGLIDKLPSPIRRNLESATVKALGQAMKAATTTRSRQWGLRAVQVVCPRRWQNCR